MMKTESSFRNKTDSIYLIQNIPLLKYVKRKNMQLEGHIKMIFMHPCAIALYHCRLNETATINI